MIGSIVPIVEGQGEVQAVPVLVRRILNELLGIWDVAVAKPVLCKRNQVVKPGKLDERIRIAQTDRENPRAILVLLDTDPDDCPAALGPQLLEKARMATSMPVAVVLANLEFEAWFLAAKESLRGFHGIREDARAPDNPEAIRAAKGELSKNMSEGRRYLPTVDQAALCSKLDLDLCRNRCLSFKKLVRDVHALVDAMRIG